MSKTKAQQVATKLKEIYEESLDLSDLTGIHDNEGPAFSDAVISRCLAAFGIFYISGASPKLCGGAVVDGGGDNGIDALYFDSKRDRLIILQSKFIKNGTGEPSLAEVKTFKDGVFDILDLKLARFNSKIQAKRSDIESINRFGVKVDIVLVHTGRSTLAQPATEEIQELLKTLNGEDDENPLYEFYQVSLERIFTKLSRGDQSRSIDLQYHLSEWGKIESPFLSFYGRIKGEILANWWNDHQERLFTENIRQLLGDTDVNSQIRETVDTEPENFWFYNNGVTLLCDTVNTTAANRDNRNWGEFMATNASVVNGAQTVGVLGRLAQAGVDLSKVEVPFRAITAVEGGDGLRKRITRFNNTQNAILSKDFIGQDPNQEELQAQVAILNYRYQVQRTEAFIPSAKAFSFDEALEGLIIIEGKTSNTATFRKEISRFYAVEKSLYQSIFNGGLTGFKLINAITFLRILKEVSQEWISALPEDPDRGRKMQVATNGLLLVGQQIFRSLFLEAQLNESLIDFDKAVVTESFSQHAENIFDACAKLYPGAYLRTLFQNITKCDAISDRVTQPD